MSILIGLFWGLLLAQEPAPAAFVDGADIAATMQRSIAGNILDTKVKSRR